MKTCIAIFICSVVGLAAFAWTPFTQAAEAAESQHRFELIIKYRDILNPKLESFSTAEAYRSRWLSLLYRADIEYIEPNGTFVAASVPNDPLFAQQWSFDIAGAESAWDVQTGSPEVVIAVIDSGIDLSHPDLADVLWFNSGEIAGNAIDDDGNGFIDDVNGWDFVESTNSPQPTFSTGWTSTGVKHGSVVAGIAGAEGNNAEGISGVGWNFRIMPLRVLDDTGHGSTLTVAQGVQYATANGADIINLSFIGSEEGQTLSNAISEARTAGVVVVAAAGNDNLDLDLTPQYPVCSDDVIGVAATGQDDRKTSFSNYGSCIDISAPGIAMTSTVVRNSSQGLTASYESGWYGTSVAAPFVAGTIGLIKSQFPQMRVDELESYLLTHVEDISVLNAGYSGKLGAGRVQLADLFGASPVSLADDIAVGLGPGQPAAVKVLTSEGTTLSSFTPFALTFTGGVHVASGDLEGDGNSEIVVGAGNGGGPHVRIFSTSGALLGSFFAYDSRFRGGVQVATGDFDGNGTSEIVAGAGVGGGPQIRIFTAQGKLLGSFFAFDPSFRGGVNVATGDLDGNGASEIIAGAGSGGGPQIRTFSSQGKLLGTFFAYAANFRGGVRVTSGDADGDAVDEIIAAPGPGGGPQVRIFSSLSTVTSQFFAFSSSDRSGLQITSIRR